MEDPEAKKALCRADTLLNMKHGMVRLDNVWGVGGGIKPVKYLVRTAMARVRIKGKRTSFYNYLTIYNFLIWWWHQACQLLGVADPNQTNWDPPPVSRFTLTRI